MDAFPVPGRLQGASAMAEAADQYKKPMYSHVTGLSCVIECSPPLHRAGRPATSRWQEAEGPHQRKPVPLYCTMHRPTKLSLESLAVALRSEVSSRCKRGTGHTVGCQRCKQRESKVKTL